jgi:hypothetical protein
MKRVRRLARKVRRVEANRAFDVAELEPLRARVETFGYTGSLLILLLLVADSLLLASSLGPAGAGAAACAVALVGVGWAARHLSPDRLRIAFFSEATATVTAVVLLQLEQERGHDLAFHLVAMASVAVAAFALWPFMWHVGWLAAVLSGLVVFQLATFGFGSNDVTTGQFVVSYCFGAVVSVTVLTILRLERYRSFQLLRRIAVVNGRTTRARAALLDSLEQLQQSHLVIRKLEGILPVCSSCGRVRADDDSEWLPLADYLVRRQALAMSHGYCPDCYSRLIDTEFGTGPRDSSAADYKR